MISWLAQLFALIQFNVQSIGERKGSSASAIFGIAGVVAVLVGVLSIGQGYRQVMAASGSSDTALVLRDVLREADRLWAAHLGPEVYDELRRSDAGEEFFSGRVRLEPVPPEREMVAVWLPFPPAFRDKVRPQLVDSIEAYGSKDDPQQGAEGLP